jgi:short-subunit dehydrogenase
MKSLIIGGTAGFGKEVVDELIKRDYNVIITGRRKISSHKESYVCDVGNLNSFQKVIHEIKGKHETIDLLICIAGFGRANKIENFSIDDWNETLNKNLVYVAIALQELTPNLKNSKKPKVITIGSQWSYKMGCSELVPYMVSKHALATLTQDYALRNKEIRANHFCVPTMNTLQLKEVQASLRKLNKELSVSDGNIAESKTVAAGLIEKALNTNQTGAIFVVDKEGNTREI